MKRKLCQLCNVKEVKRNASKYCSVKCQKDYEYQQYIEGWLEGKETGNNKNGCSGHVRRFFIAAGKCWLCGWNKINPVTKQVPLEIHHVDGNYLNNKPDNLQVLCPNCHSITKSYKNLNKGKGRKHRKLAIELAKEFRKSTEDKAMQEEAEQFHKDISTITPEELFRRFTI